MTRAAIIVLALILADFLLTALIIKGICFAFGLVFTWKMVFGVWLILLLVQSVFRQGGGRRR